MTGEAPSGIIRLVLIDDHALFRESLCHLLSQQPDFTVCGTYAGVSEAAPHLHRETPDIILLDVDLGQERALDLFRDCKEISTRSAVIIVTAGVTPLEAVQLVHAGARGIFHKHNPPQSLCDAIRRVHLGDVVLESNYLKVLFQAADPESLNTRPRLSEREIEVLRKLLQGMANKEIADGLRISESSVKAILRQLFDKLSVRSRSQLVKIALDEYRELL